MIRWVIPLGAALALITAPALARDGAVLVSGTDAAPVASAAPLPSGAQTAAGLPAQVLAAMRAADVVILGEVHDNPFHHSAQAELIDALDPAAVVWEMLTPDTAARFNNGWLDQPGHLEQAIAMAEANWPDFDLYLPVLVAAQGRAIYGGLVPREAARRAADLGIGAIFGVGAAEYGLMVPLPADERARRLDEQRAAHCYALPEEMLPLMVDIQRLRDATLARAAITAMEETGGPVVVITGNGHARRDGGVPDYLARVRPGLTVFALGQSESGAIAGRFDALRDAPAVDRPDPCLAFGAGAAGGD